MIRILNKPLLKEWTTAQPFKPVANPTRSFSGCRRHLSATSYALVRHRAPSSLLLVRTSALYYSTVPDQTHVKTKADVPPPSKSIPKKPKVDLRPAPKKLSREPSGNVKLPRAPSSTPQSKSASSSSTSTQPVASKSPPGIIETTKHDIAEATKHGILTPPPEDASRVGRLWHQMKQLFWFYWGGLKMIFVTHRRQAGEIRRRAAEAKARGEKSGLSRWETRFLQTYNKDLVKMVPFILTLIILEEALPLVVLYAPGLLPSTCLLPSQRERIEAKRRAKQIVHLEGAKAELLRPGQHSLSSLTESGAKSLNPSLARAISGAFLCSTWGPLFLQQRRIEKRLAYLSSDDALLVKEDLGSRLKEEDLVEALEERGIIPDSRSPHHLRDQLQWWLKGAFDDNARLGLVLQAAIKDIRGTEGKVKTDI